MMKLVMFCAMLVCCAWSSSAQGTAAGASVYCGQRLSETLAVLCWGPAVDKRNWVPPASALAGVRGKRGPVDECCDKPCTVDELIQYC